MSSEKQSFARRVYLKLLAALKLGAAGAVDSLSDYLVLFPQHAHQIACSVRGELAGAVEPLICRQLWRLVHQLVVRDEEYRSRFQVELPLMVRTPMCRYVLAFYREIRPQWDGVFSEDF